MPVRVRASSSPYRFQITLVSLVVQNHFRGLSTGRPGLAVTSQFLRIDAMTDRVQLLCSHDINVRPSSEEFRLIGLEILAVLLSESP